MQETKTESTMASFQLYFSSDASKSPLKIIKNRTSLVKNPGHNGEPYKPPRIYRLKSSKQSSAKKLNSFEFSLNEYFSGVSLKLSRNSFSHKTCTLECVLKGNKNSVNCVESFYDKIWSGGRDSSLRVWPKLCESDNPYSAQSYTKGCSFGKSEIIGTHKKQITGLKNCGQVILSGSLDGNIKIWNSECALIKSIQDYPGQKCLESLGCDKVISGGSNLNFWDLNLCEKFRENIPTKSVECVVGHTSQTFFTGSQDCSVKLWDIRTPRNISCLLGHNDTVSGIALLSSLSVLSCSEDCTLKEWDLRKQETLSSRKAKEKLRSVVVHKNYVVTGGNSFTIWNQEIFEEIQFHDGSVKNLLYSNEHDLLFAAGCDGLISVWSVWLLNCVFVFIFV